VPTCWRCWPPNPAPPRWRCCPRTLDGLYALAYGLVAAATDEERLPRAMAIAAQLPELRAPQPLPLAEVQTLVVELLAERALRLGLEQALLASPEYLRYSQAREAADRAGRSADGRR
jgi:hypothetical protein